MMRISPLGIFGANHDAGLVAEWARQDAAITHPHPVCQQANALFTMAIAHAIRQGCDGRGLYEQIVTWAEDMKVDGASWKRSEVLPNHRQRIMSASRGGC